ncbi:MAG: sigma-70 family RNA polymerase sigma factor, partial [Solirubrobacteraceae bacterium]
MFAAYQPLARKLARRYTQTSVPVEDLQQVAYIGLLLAVDRFDPERGRPFASFAIPTILGEVRRHLRDHSRPVHVSRTAQERSVAVRVARE